jgi:hypothetical protein
LLEERDLKLKCLIKCKNPIEILYKIVGNFFFRNMLENVVGWNLVVWMVGFVE